MLVQEVLSRTMRDRRAVARYGGLTGSPDESPERARPIRPDKRMGPPPRSFAADAHHASWSGVSGPTAYKDVARTFVHHTRAPLDLVIPTAASLPSCSKPSRTSLRWR